MEDPSNVPSDQSPVMGHGDMSSKPPPAVFGLTKSIDPRIAPEDAGYTAPTGAASVTTVQQKLLQLNNSVHTFNVTPPSAGVVIQKSVVYTMSGNLDFFASTEVNCVNVGQAFPVYGRDLAIAKPSPLNAMVSNWQVQINNATVQWNSQGFDDIVHLMETPSTRAEAGVSKRTPMFTTWDDAAETLYSLGSVDDLQGRGDVPPGAYPIAWVVPSSATVYAWTCNPQFSWLMQGVLPAGAPLAQVAYQRMVQGAFPSGSVFCYSTSNTGAPGPDAVAVNWEGPSNSWGQPLVAPTARNFSNPSGANTTPQLYALQFYMVDTVQCPPFGWHIEQGYEDQGIWGVNNMLITAQLTDPGQARWLQGTQRYGLGALTYAQKWNCLGATLWFTYLSPSTTNLEVLPPRCVVPLMYKQVTTYLDTTKTYPPSFDPANPLVPKQYSMQVPSYTFSQVSDYLVISIRPNYNAYSTPLLPFYQTDFCATFPDQVFSQFQYANIPGILSNLAAHQLVAMCRKNGSKASVAQYGGLTGTGQMMSGGLSTGMGGSVIVLRPGIDFALPIGIASGSMGNIQLQFTIQFLNQSSATQTFVCSTMALSSGFFVLDNGAARQVLVGLNSKSLYDADISADVMDSVKLTGGGLLSTLSSFAGKAWRHRKHIAKLANTARAAYTAWKGDKGGGGGSYAMAGAGYSGGGYDEEASLPGKRPRGGAVSRGYGVAGNTAYGGGRGEHRGSLLAAIAADRD